MLFHVSYGKRAGSTLSLWSIVFTTYTSLISRQYSEFRISAITYVCRVYFELIFVTHFVFFFTFRFHWKSAIRVYNTHSDLHTMEQDTKTHVCSSHSGIDQNKQKQCVFDRVFPCRSVCEYFCGPFSRAIKRKYTREHVSVYTCGMCAYMRNSAYFNQGRINRYIWNQQNWRSYQYAHV